jgi:hypothetical protein
MMVDLSKHGGQPPFQRIVLFVPLFLKVMNHTFHRIHLVLNFAVSMKQWSNHKPTLMAKVYTKGSVYIYTDTSNHYGATTDMKGKEELKPACQRYMKESKFPNPYFQTNLPLLHMQDMTFHDWIMHHMRGASSYGYNKLGKEIMGCDGLNGGHALLSTLGSNGRVKV